MYTSHNEKQRTYHVLLKPTLPMRPMRWMPKIVCLHVCVCVCVVYAGVCVWWKFVSCNVVGASHEFCVDGGNVWVTACVRRELAYIESYIKVIPLSEVHIPHHIVEGCNPPSFVNYILVTNCAKRI